jgi:hypothetical protein
VDTVFLVARDAGVLVTMSHAHVLEGYSVQTRAVVLVRRVCGDPTFHVKRRCGPPSRQIAQKRARERRSTVARLGWEVGRFP